MWKYNSDYNKWFANDDSISKNDFDYLKQARIYFFSERYFKFQAIKFWNLLVYQSLFIFNF